MYRNELEIILNANHRHVLLDFPSDLTLEEVREIQDALGRDLPKIIFRESVKKFLKTLDKTP